MDKMIKINQINQRILKIHKKKLNMNKIKQLK